MIVSPYIGPRPFAMLRQRYGPPKHAAIVTDTSTPAEVLRECADSLGGARALYAPWPGLLHAKLVVFEFVGPRRTKTWWVSFGSANMSTNGLTERGNLELLAGGPVARDAIRAWAQSVLDGEATSPLHLEWDELKARMPALPKLVDVEAHEALDYPFDAWLRAGELVHKWAPASDFARLQLPVDDRDPALNKILERFTEGRGQSMRRMPFLMPSGPFRRRDHLDLPDEKRVVTRWRAKFTVETILGQWVSRRCASEMGDGFAGENMAKRKEEILRLRELSPSKLPRVEPPEIGAVKERVRALAKAVRQTGQDVEQVFGKSARELEEHMVERARHVIERDSRRASLSTFAHRHILGVERFPVPGFGVDRRAWDLFVESWVRTVVLETEKSQAQSLVAKALRRVAGRELRKSGSDERVDAVLKALRDRRRNIDPLIDYHRQEKGHPGG